MFKPIKCPHSRLDSMTHAWTAPDGSLRQVKWPAYKCFTTKEWVLTWQTLSREEALKKMKEYPSFILVDFESGLLYPPNKSTYIYDPAITHRDGRIYDGAGREITVPIKLHYDHIYEVFMRTPVNFEKYRGVVGTPWIQGDLYLTIAMRSWNQWRRPYRPQYFQQGRYYREADVLNIPEFDERVSPFVPRDYQKPWLEYLALGCGPITNKVISMGIRGKPEHDKIVNLGDMTYVGNGNHYPHVEKMMITHGSEDRLEGGFRRDEMLVLGSHGANFSHMRAALEAARRGKRLLRISFEDSNLSSLDELIKKGVLIADERMESVIVNPKFEFDRATLDNQITIREKIEDIDVAESYPKTQGVTEILPGEQEVNKEEKKDDEPGS